MKLKLAGHVLNGLELDSITALLTIYNTEIYEHSHIFYRIQFKLAATRRFRHTHFQGVGSCTIRFGPTY